LNAAAEELRAKLQRLGGFLKSDPANPSLALEVAELHAHLAEFAEAESVIVAALAKNPADARLRSQLATTYIAANQPEKAIGLLQSLLASGQAHPVLRYNLAYALLLARRAQEARDQLLAAVDSPEAAPQTKLLLARALHHCGDLEGAEKHISAYLNDAPADPEALGVAALIHFDSSHPERAKETAEQALEHNTDNLGALVTLGSLALEREDQTAANDYFARATERHPASGRAWSGMGLTSMFGFDLDRALEDLQRAVRHMPDHVGTWHSLAWCQIVRRDFAGAQASFDRAMALDRNFGETHGGLAVVHILQGRLDVAEPEVKRALRLDPNCFSGRFAQSLLLQKSDPEKAKAVVEGIMSSSAVPGGEKLQDILRRSLRRAPAGQRGPAGPKA
jgi:tetratricopeptide (TPR) repeat protein